MIRTITAALFVLTLSFQLYTQSTEISGKCQFQAIGKTEGKGAYLHIWTYRAVVADKDRDSTKFKVTKVGANAVSFVSKDNGATIAKPNADGRYTLELARNNAGGAGNQHQLWGVLKKWKE